MKRFAVIATLALATACAGNKEQAHEKVSLTFQAQLDSGNAAYRRGDYKESAEFFYAATESDKENLSGWYGVYMAESKLGNKEAAAKAQAVVAEKAPEMPTTEHPTSKNHRPGALAAPGNPHAPTADNPHASLPLDSIRAARAKQKESNQ